MYSGHGADKCQLIKPIMHEKVIRALPVRPTATLGFR